MALFLYRVGQTSFRHRRLVLDLWVLILVGSSLLEPRVGGRAAVLTEDVATV